MAQARAVQPGLPRFRRANAEVHALSRGCVSAFIAFHARELVAAGAEVLQVGLVRSPRRSWRLRTTFQRRRTSLHLQFLPPDVRQALCCVYRRKGLLNNAMLQALVDDSWTVLDLSGTKVTDLGLARVLRGLPHLLALDISRCRRLTRDLLSCLGRLCPKLQVLRLGGCDVSDRVALSALESFLPELCPPSRNTGGAGPRGRTTAPPCAASAELMGRWAGAHGVGAGEDESERGGLVSREGEDGLVECWESLCGVSGAAEIKWGLKTRGLAHLTHLVWPGAPRRVAVVVARRCPRVALVPPPDSEATPRLWRRQGARRPPLRQADPRVPLDQFIADGISPRGFEASQPAAPPHASAVRILCDSNRLFATMPRCGRVVLRSQDPPAVDCKGTPRRGKRRISRSTTASDRQRGAEAEGSPDAEAEVQSEAEAEAEAERAWREGLGSASARRHVERWLDGGW